MGIDGVVRAGLGVDSDELRAIFKSINTTATMPSIDVKSVR
jgi:hypothetical protein